MLTIRLARIGRKNRPYFRLIVSEKSKDTFGDFLEILGSFDPRHKKETLKLKEDRIKYWLEKGTQTSATVHNLLIEAKIIQGKKVKVTKLKKKEKEKGGEEKSKEKEMGEEEKTKS